MAVDVELKTKGKKCSTGRPEHVPVLLSTGSME